MPQTSKKESTAIQRKNREIIFRRWWGIHFPWLPARNRWFPALVGNHIADILKWYGSDTREVPEALTAYVQKREGTGADEGYDYSQHTQMDDENTYYVIHNYRVVELNLAIHQIQCYHLL